MLILINLHVFMWVVKRTQYDIFPALSTPYVAIALTCWWMVLSGPSSHPLFLDSQAIDSCLLHLYKLRKIILPCLLSIELSGHSCKNFHIASEVRPGGDTVMGINSSGGENHSGKERKRAAHSSYLLWGNKKSPSEPEHLMDKNE